MRVRIEKVVYGGYGIGYKEDKTYFVPYTLKGEEVEVSSCMDKKDYAECSLERVLSPSEFRVKPLCKYYTICGGCDLQHTTYTNQLNLKSEIFKDQLKRIGKIDFETLEIVPSENPFHYRNRVQFKFDGQNFGFHMRNSNNTVDIDNCLLLKEDLVYMITPIKRFLIKYGLVAENIHIFSNDKNEKLVRFIFKNPQQLLNVVPNIDIINQEIDGKIVGVSFESKENRIYLGQKHVFYLVDRYRFRVSMDSFFQVNIYQIKNLINIVLKYLDILGSRKVMDFYCGVGTFSIPAKSIANEVLGIEANESAVKDAKANIGHNKLKNIKFLKAKAEKGIRYAFDFKPDTIIFDPPRSGIDKKVIKEISKIAQLRNIIYISCNPATLARDLNHIKEAGFKIDSITLLDMFPQTHHIESVSLLKRI